MSNFFITADFLPAEMSEFFPNAAFVFFFFVAKSLLQINIVHIGQRAQVDKYIGQLFGNVASDRAGTNRTVFGVFSHGRNDFAAFFGKKAAFKKFVGSVEAPFLFHFQNILLKVLKGWVCFEF